MLDTRRKDKQVLRANGTTRLPRLIARILSEESLTKRASLNALSSALDYGARLVVAFVVTPWMVAGLGSYYYGIWQILNRLVGYLAPTTGKPTQVLQSTLANQQASTDYQQKRRYVGATLGVWVLFFPIIGIAGGVLTWFAPIWLQAPAQYAFGIRATAAILVVNLLAASLGYVPESALLGENLGYKRIGLTVLLILLGGGLTWFVLRLGAGIIGVAALALLVTVFTGLLWLMVARRYIPWFGVGQPSRQQLWRFWRLSWWYLSSSVLITLMISSDVILLGFLGSVESVTSYTLTKYAPETAVSLVAIMFAGTVPGLGGIIGSGDMSRAARLRGELMALSWAIVASLGATVVVWNHSFVNLWVGNRYYAGLGPTVLLVLISFQYVFIRNDSSIIDLTLHLNVKVVLGAISVSISLILAGILIAYAALGMVGLCLGLLAGRSLMSIGYPVIMGRFLGLPLTTQLKGVIRPALVTLLVFMFAAWAGGEIPVRLFSGVKGWLALLAAAGLTCLFLLIVVVYLGFTARQRTMLGERVQLLLRRV